MKNKADRMRAIFQLAPVVPVVAFDTVEQAVETSRALVAGGLPVIEITLRTEKAIDCIAAVAKHVDGAVVGAGTVLDAAAMVDCVAVGAQFLVSPGTTMDLLKGLKRVDVPLLPGIATPSEAMGLYSEGIEVMKFFPAEQSGGAAALKAMSAVFPHISFCPTGGITAKNAKDYLALPNVIGIGGSWVAPKTMVEAGQWDKITALAAEAANLG